MFQNNSNLKVIEPLINFNKVKYDKLTELINKSNMDGNKLNMFINIDSILMDFYQEDVVDAMNSLVSKENIILTAELINLIAHYRQYFWSRYQSPVKFYLYSVNKSVKLCKDNNPEYMNKVLFIKNKDNVKTGLMNDIIESNINLIKTIIKYIKNAYYIESDGLDPSVIPYYFIKKNNDEKVCNWILTKDLYDHQLLSLNNTFILKPRGEKTKLLGVENIYDKYFGKLKYKPDNKFSPELFPLIMALHGHRDRNIPRIKGFTFVKICKAIDELISNGMMINDKIYNINNIKSILSNEYDRQLLEDNFNCTNLDLHYKALSKTQKTIIKNNIIDLYDNESIMNINNTYFPNNNIQLIELCKGVDW